MVIDVSRKNILRNWFYWQTSGWPPATLQTSCNRSFSMDACLPCDPFNVMVGMNVTLGCNAWVNSPCIFKSSAPCGLYERNFVCKLKFYRTFWWHLPVVTFLNWFPFHLMCFCTLQRLKSEKLNSICSFSIPFALLLSVVDCSLSCMQWHQLKSLVRRWLRCNMRDKCSHYTQFLRVDSRTIMIRLCWWLSKPKTKHRMNDWKRKIVSMGFGSYSIYRRLSIRNQLKIDQGWSFVECSVQLPNDEIFGIWTKCFVEDHNHHRTIRWNLFGVIVVTLKVNFYLSIGSEMVDQFPYYLR